MLAARLSSKATFVTDCSFAAELTVIYAPACFNEKLARIIQAAALSCLRKNLWRAAQIIIIIFFSLYPTHW
jgi:hypothetical protein